MKPGAYFRFIKGLLLAAVLGLAVFFFCKEADRLNQGQQKESLKQLENSLRKAVVTCYAVEGVYPPSIAYLEKHYGVQIEKERYTVFYEIQGSNLMPGITVVENE